MSDDDVQEAFGDDAAAADDNDHEAPGDDAAAADDVQKAPGDDADDHDHGAPGGDPGPTGEGPDGAAVAGDDGRDVRRYLNLAALGVLAVLALVATLRFYFAASATIDTWVAREYRSLFQAAFNLAVLLVAVGGLALQLRRLDR